MKTLSPILLLCVITLNGCSTTSQQRSTSPHFDGVLTYNELTLNNTKVMLSTEPGDKLCLKARRFTTTNQLGQFNLKATTEDYSYTPFINYEMDEWNICAMHNDNIISLYSNNRYGSGHVKGSVYLKCDLGQSSANTRCNISQ